jgi:hypothetical protein
MPQMRETAVTEGHISAAPPAIQGNPIPATNHSNATEIHCVPDVTDQQEARNPGAKPTGFSGVTNRPIMATIGGDCVAWNLKEKSSVIASRPSVVLIAALAACVVLQPSRAHAQWWSRAPADYEECADKAEKAPTRETRTSALTECNAKFAGRRKPGGGYSYFDFMQNRSFDIAGPNPTPEEQKQIDEHYTAFLDRERQSQIAAAFAAKQQLLQQASLRSEKVPLPVQAPNKQPAAAAASDLRSRAKDANCARHSFSCDWPRLSESIKDLKKLFGSSQAKAKRG